MNKFLGAMLLATVLPAATAQAAPVVFDTTKAGIAGSNSSESWMTYTSGGVSMKVSGWRLDPATTFFGWTISPATVDGSSVVSYSAGLGVLSSGESASNTTHTIDNQSGADFVVLQFDQAVTLSSVDLALFSLGGSTDGDMTIGWGTQTGAWNRSLGLDGMTESSLDAMFAPMVERTGGGGTRSLGLGSTTGNLWLIGASQTNADGLIDAFKLAKITVNTVTAVPEPATWAMMLVGFGMVGAAARYRRRQTTVAIA